MPRQALIVGLGLIGGAAGMALRSRGWRVAYVDPNVEERDARAPARPASGGTRSPEMRTWSCSRPRFTPRWRCSRAGYGVSRCHHVCLQRDEPIRAAAGGAELSLAIRSRARTPRSRGGADRSASRPVWFVEPRERLVRPRTGLRCAQDRRDAARTTMRRSRSRVIFRNFSRPRSGGARRRRRRHVRRQWPGTFLRLAGSDVSVWAPMIEANRITSHAL